MTINEIFKMLNTDPAYEFLRTEPLLGNRLIFLTLGGSHAYGTNVDSSDVDIRGCTKNRASDLIGFSHLEQRVDERTDTTIYAFNKLIQLLMSCNPNTIEMLGCKPEHYIYMTDVGKEMLDNRKLFLSQRAVNAFGGYATQQLRRLENALARGNMEQARKEEHIRNSMERAVMAFENKYTDFDFGSIRLFTDESQRPELEREVFVDIHLNHYPARSLDGMLNEMANIIKDYDKLNGRNKKKDDAHLNKHAMHLIRLYLMWLDILEKEEINTYRENDREFLLSIRNGAFQKEDGTFRDEFFEIVSDFEKKLTYAKENTSLPMHPDMRQVEEFVMSVNRRIIEDERDSITE